MRPASFEYCKPRSLAELQALLRDNDGNRKILAGGQSLVPMMNFRMAMPGVLIDINGLHELDYVDDAGSALRIGALARHNRVMHSEVVRAGCPLLAQAYENVAHHTVRNRGTLAGNVCHADPASEMPAVLLALDAVLHVQGQAGVRRVVAEDFFLGMYTTAVEPDEFLAEIEIPKFDASRTGHFLELSQRKGDFAICGIAVAFSLVHGLFKDVRIACCGVGEKQSRLVQAEQWLENRPADAASIAGCGSIAAGLVDPPSDTKASGAYRRHLVGVLSAKAIEAALADLNRR